MMMMMMISNVPICPPCLLLLLLLLLLITVFRSHQQSTTVPPSNSFSVSVRCSSRAMEMFVQFREPFHGRLKTRPNGLCLVNGRGRSRVGFRLPLDDEHRQRCAIIRRETEFVAIVDLEMSPGLITAEDNAYFLRCPIEGTKTEQMKETARKEELEEDRQEVTVTSPLPKMQQIRRWEGREAEELLRLGLTRGSSPLRLRKCAVFMSTTADGRVRAVQISDENGCPITFASADQSAPFSGQLQFRAPAEFGDGPFFVQCEVTNQQNEAEETPCPPTAASDRQLPPSDASSLHFLRAHRFPQQEATSGTNNVSSSSASSSFPPSSSVDHFSNLAIFVSLLLLLCAITFTFLALWHCSKAPPKRRKIQKITNYGQCHHQQRQQQHRQISCTARHSVPMPNRRESSLSSGDALSFGHLSPTSLKTVHSSSPSEPNQRKCRQKDHLSQHRPSSSETKCAATELASSLDRLPEPPSLSLDEVRQLNEAFNRERSAAAAGDQREPMSTATATVHNCQRVYSFAGIRLNNIQRLKEPASGIDQKGSAKRSDQKGQCHQKRFAELIRQWNGQGMAKAEEEGRTKNRRRNY